MAGSGLSGRQLWHSEWTISFIVDDYKLGTICIMQLKWSLKTHFGHLVLMECVFFPTMAASSYTPLPSQDICEERETCFQGSCTTASACNFYAAVSDGHKYIFASKDENGGKVSIFDLKKGLYLGSYPTCARPVAMDYAPHREEIWVHCFSPDDEDYGDTGHVDILSASAWGFDHSQIALPDQALGDHTHGWIELDAMTPNFAWATTREHPYLAQIDVHTHEVFTHDMSSHGCAALNSIAASWQNKHLYFHCHVCCSCGVNADTGVTCESARGTPQEVTLQDGTTALGFCGISCDGSAADTVGLVEFDTVSKTVVATHYFPDFGSGSPMTSADSSLVVLESRFNSAVKVLQVGENGVASSDARARDIETGFTPRSHRDTLFVQQDKMNLAVFSSVEENYVVVADLESGTTTTIELTEATESTAASGRLASRSMAWATGTSFVMVSGSSADELYVIDINKKGLVRTITNNPNSFIIHAVAMVDAAGSDGKDGDDAKFGNSERILLILALIIGAISLCLVLLLALYTTRLNNNLNTYLYDQVKSVEGVPKEPDGSV